MVGQHQKYKTVFIISKPKKKNHRKTQLSAQKTDIGETFKYLH